MSELIRNIAPPAKQIDDIHFPDIEKYHLKNGIPIYSLNSGTQDIIKMDLVFEAGQWFSDNPLTPAFCNRMLIEGSQKYTHAEIAEKLDFYGTFSNFESGKHFSHIQLFTLSNFFDKSVELLEDFAKNPLFPEEQLKVLIQNEIQQFVVSKEKTDVLAADEFIVRNFGANHPYGRIRKLSHFENINLDELKKFHKQYYNSSNCKIMVSGKLNEQVLKTLEMSFGNSDWMGEKANPGINNHINTEKGRFLVNKNGAVQSSIIIGKKTINKKHPDYFGLSILNTILGGYFGSRLMTSLREKEALTYGIYSSLSSAMHSGTISISANVNSDLAEKAISSIYKEIELLKNELISDEELNMVKNYLSGEMLRAFDGPMAVSEIFLDILPYGIELNYYKKYFETLKSISAYTLNDLANKYLQNDGFIEVIAGNHK
jgi:predicted Zn-dependent peptidase